MPIFRTPNVVAPRREPTFVLWKPSESLAVRLRESKEGLRKYPFKVLLVKSHPFLSAFQSTSQPNAAQCWGIVSRLRKQVKSYLGRLVPWTTRTFIRTTRTLDDSYLGRLVPSIRTTRTVSRWSSRTVTSCFLFLVFSTDDGWENARGIEDKIWTSETSWMARRMIEMNSECSEFNFLFLIPES